MLFISLRRYSKADLVESGVINKKIGWGVKLLGRGKDELDFKIDLEVSRVSAEAKAAVEAQGGSVVKVHYNKLGIRALLKPHKFPNGLPKPARTPPFLKHKVDREGTLPPTGRAGGVQQEASL